jgi:hypothetical protein
MPNRENGTSLEERVTNHVPQALSNAAATFVDSLKINSISEKVRRGRPVVIKRRNVYGEQLADLANLYFRMSGIPIRFWSKAKEWQRWEASCFRMLNGDRFRAFTSGTRTVCFDKLPGKSLWEHLNEGTLTRRMEPNFGAPINFGATNSTPLGHMAIRLRQMSFTTKKLAGPDLLTSRSSTTDRSRRNRDTPTMYSSFCWTSLR